MLRYITMYTIYRYIDYQASLHEQLQAHTRTHTLVLICVPIKDLKYLIEIKNKI